MCQVSPVACHLSLTPRAKATDPLSANSPIMHSKLVCKDRINRRKKAKPQKSLKQQKPKSVYIIYEKNATLGTSLAFQMSMLEKFEKVFFLNLHFRPT